jgi:hypothetical protein
LGKFLTLAAVGLGYWLWTFSAKVEEWVAVPSLLPVVRLGVIVFGLSVAEAIYRYTSQWLSSRQSRDQSEGI